MSDRNGSTAASAVPPGTAVSECPLCGGERLTLLYEREAKGNTWQLKRCRDCRLSFTSPRPTSDFLIHYYAEDYHAGLRTAGAAERLFGTKYQRYVERLAAHLRCGTVIDVGCSTGLLVRLLQDRGFDARGIELNEQSAKWGQEHYGVPISNMAFEPASMNAESVDAFTMTDFLEHTLDPLETLRETWRVLRPNGYILVTFPNVWSLESQLLFWTAKLSQRDWAWATCHIPGHIWEFTPNTARAMFERGGFRVVELQRTHPVESPAPRWLRMIHAPTRLLSIGPLANKFGTQMEFLVQKVTPPSTFLS